MPTGVSCVATQHHPFWVLEIAFFWISPAPFSHQQFVPLVEPILRRLIFFLPSATSGLRDPEAAGREALYYNVTR